MARKRPAVTHVSLYDKDIVCFHCGKRDTVIHGPGIAINSPAWAGFMAHGEAFEKAHAGCPETSESPTQKLETSPMEWERGLFVGSSSGTIFFVLGGRLPLGFARDRLGATPRDPGDFSRCHRLLRVMPEWRSRLGEVAAKYPAWGPLVASWDELTERLKIQDPGMYDRMQALMGEGSHG